MLAGSFSLGGTEDVEPPITLHPAAVRCCGRPRPQLRRGGPEGIGRLQGMAPLNPTMALAALPDMDVELPVDGLARDLDLELLGDVRLVERTAAVGAAVRQGRLVNLIDLVRGGRLAVGLDPVVSAGLATGLLWLAGGLTLGEGGRLALAGTGRLVELAAEALVLGLQVTQASLKGLASGTRDGLHTSMIGEVLATTVIPRPRSRDQLDLDALNNYSAVSTVVGAMTPGESTFGPKWPVPSFIRTPVVLKKWFPSIRSGRRSLFTSPTSISVGGME